jgi:hypothetical protein
VDSVRLYRKSLAILERSGAPEFEQSHAAYRRLLKEANLVMAGLK